MASRAGTRSSSVRRLASTVYDAQAGGRWPVLDGPWWLAVVLLVAGAGVVWGSGPLRWLALGTGLVLLTLPFLLRCARALWRSVGAFREGLRS